MLLPGSVGVLIVDGASTPEPADGGTAKLQPTAKWGKKAPGRDKGGKREVYQAELFCIHIVPTSLK